jgi:Flp pilus assembly protein TadB
MTLIGAFVGVMASAGVLLIGAGWRGVQQRERSRPSVHWSTAGPSVALAVLAGMIGWSVTGWPAVGGLAASVAVIAPKLLGARARRDAARERSEALASWAEMLRDTVSSHAGLREAISITARVAPGPIREEVQRLSARAERDHLTRALRQFATEVNDPVADLIVAALVIAADRQAHRLSDLLGQIAGSAREQVGMRTRVETGRARTYASSRALVMITFGFATMLMIFSPKYMAPYDSMVGQIVLVGIAALFAAALWGLVELSRPASAPRILAGVEQEIGN